MAITHQLRLWTALALTGLGLICFPGCQPQSPAHGTTYVLKVEMDAATTAQSDEAVVVQVESALRQRLERFGYEVTMKSPKGLPRLIRLTTSAGGADLPVLRKLVTQKGLLRFSWIHSESQKLLEKKELPSGYEIHRESRRASDGKEPVISHLVSTQAIAGLSNPNLKKAAVSRDPSTQAVSLTLDFNEAGAAAFANATDENVGRMLAVMIDNTLASAPVIRSKIEGGRAVISGQANEREALTTAALLNHPIMARITLVEETTF